MRMRLNRRTLLGMLAASVGATALRAPNAWAMPSAIADQPALRNVAASHGRLFGAAVFSKHLRHDDEFAQAVAKECNLLVAEGEMKWDVLWPSRHVWNFSGADWLMKFADDQAMSMRGHTLIWHQAMPNWGKEAIRHGEGQQLIERFIEEVMGRYRGRIVSWDVVNEAVDAKSPDGVLRDTFWLRGLGPDYIASAFRLAHAADPKAKLYYNDFDAERAGPEGTAKRAALLKLLRTLKDKNVPIDGLGLQSHLVTYRKFPTKEFTTFCKSVRALGLDIIVTELDVYEGPLRVGSEADQDARVVSAARAFLDALNSVVVPRELLTWGLSDRYTWRRWYHRDDGLRPLPLDEDLNRKPFWNEIKNALEIKTPAKA